MTVIDVAGLSKNYHYYKREPGIKNALRGFFHREMLVKEALKTISFSLDEGEMVGLIGANGSGKTTTIKLLSGILKPDGGSISVMGFDPFEKDNRFKRQLALVMAQKNQLWWDLPAQESLLLNKCIYEIEDTEFQKTMNELVDMFDVKGLLDVQVRRLSLGERMKFELIAALIHKPKVVFLDEPTIGLDFMTQRKIRNFLKYYNQEKKTTVIITSHNMQDIENLCNRVIMINTGSIIFDGALETLSKSENYKLVKLKVESPLDGQQRRQLDTYGEVLETDPYTMNIKVLKETMSATVKNLIDRLPIVDFSIEDVPLEEIISNFYQN